MKSPTWTKNWTRNTTNQQECVLIRQQIVGIRQQIIGILQERNLIHQQIVENEKQLTAVISLIITGELIQTSQ